MRVFTSVLVAATSVASSAHAEAPPPAPFVIMDDSGDPSKLDLDLGLGFDIDSDGYDDGSILFRLGLHGQYVARAGFGGYVGMAGASWLFEDGPNTGDAFGNLQLGGLFQRQLSPNVHLGVRLGLALPTATGYDDPGNRVIIDGTIAMRPADTATVLVDTTCLRTSVSPTYRRGSLTVRVDGGTDLPLDVPEESIVDAIAYINAGVGAMHGKLAATAEVQNVAWLREHHDVWVHTVAMSLSYRGRQAAPFVALSSPLDDVKRGQVLTLMLGLSAY